MRGVRKVYEVVAVFENGGVRKEIPLPCLYSKRKEAFLVRDGLAASTTNYKEIVVVEREVLP